MAAMAFEAAARGRGGELYRGESRVVSDAAVSSLDGAIGYDAQRGFTWSNCNAR
jgi:hypothetical protein